MKNILEKGGTQIKSEVNRYEIINVICRWL